MQSHHQTDRKNYISQSEVKRAQDCPLAWYAEFVLGLKPAVPESRPQRIGSLAHAVVEDHVLARWYNHTHPTSGIAMMDTMRRRGYVRDEISSWDEVHADLMADCDAAERAAETFIRSPHFDVRAPVIHNGAPVVEMDIRAHWGATQLVMAPLHVQKRGMVGTPDIVHDPDAYVRYVDDYKFRQKPDLGGTLDAPESGMPDQQGAWYKVLLRGAGLASGRDVVFRQINVYAGTWLTLDDFMREGSPFVIDSGLPSRDLKTLGGLVRPEVWGEAWRLLVEKRRVESLHRSQVPQFTKTGKPKKSPGVRLASETETWDAKEFIRKLENLKTIQVVEHRLDESVCVDVVRDMLASVAALYAQVAAGIVPGRNLRTYERSPCVRPYGCDVQAPCMAALGTGRTVEVLREHAADGRLRLQQAPHGAVGSLDPATLAAMGGAS